MLNVLPNDPVECWWVGDG